MLSVIGCLLLIYIYIYVLFLNLIINFRNLHNQNVTGKHQRELGFLRNKHVNQIYCVVNKTKREKNRFSSVFNIFIYRKIIFELFDLID